MELHSRRVERIALKLAAVDDADVDRLALRCAALLHDIGLYDPWWDGGPYTNASARRRRRSSARAGLTRSAYRSAAPRSEGSTRLPIRARSARRSSSFAAPI